MKNLKISSEIGKLGEDIALKYVLKLGFSLVCRNYLTQFGEIDIVAEKDGKLHFVEVKSVSCADLSEIDSLKYKPEDNVHAKKLERLCRTIEIYCNSQKTGEKPWEIDVLSIFINKKTKEAKVRPIWNIVI